MGGGHFGLARGGIGARGSNGQAGTALRANVLACAASRPTDQAGELEHPRGIVVNRDSGTRPSLQELARIAYFRPNTLPPRLSGGADGDAPLRAARLEVRFHQRVQTSSSKSIPSPAS